MNEWSDQFPILSGTIVMWSDFLSISIGRVAFLVIDWRDPTVSTKVNLRLVSHSDTE